MLSAKTNFVVSSTPSRPAAMPRSFSPCATRSNGLSSSCQVATSVCSSGPPRELFARAILFERRADEVRVADLRNDDRDQPLAVAPADAGEVDQRRAAGRE